MSEHLEPTLYSDGTWGLTLWDDQTGEKCPLAVSLWDVHEGAEIYAERLATAYNAITWEPGSATPPAGIQLNELMTEALWQALEQSARSEGYPFLILHARTRGLTYTQAQKLLTFVRSIDTERAD